MDAVMKKITVALGCLVLLASLASTARADAISFSFTFVQTSGGFTANQVGGLSLGSATVINVSDATTHVNKPLSGYASISSGVTTNWVPIFADHFAAVFGPGGSLSVADSHLNPYVTGTPTYADYFWKLGDTGSGDGQFNVSFVSPAILAMFGIDPTTRIAPTGSFSWNTAGNTMVGPVDTATLTAGAITVYTVVPEPGTLALLGTGVLGLAGMLRRKMKS